MLLVEAVVVPPSVVGLGCGLVGLGEVTSGAAVRGCLLVEPGVVVLSGDDVTVVVESRHAVVLSVDGVLVVSSPERERDMVMALPAYQSHKGHYDTITPTTRHYRTGFPIH